MNKEDLLKTRYRMKINMPCSDFKKGDVINGDSASISTHRSHVDILCSAYPDCYEPLPWYAERKVSEMPEYVKHKNGNVYRHKYMFEKEMYYNQECAGHYIGWLEVTDEFKDYTPSDLTEYSSFLKQKVKP